MVVVVKLWNLNLDFWDYLPWLLTISFIIYSFDLSFWQLRNSRYVISWAIYVFMLTMYKFLANISLFFPVCVRCTLIQSLQQLLFASSTTAQPILTPRVGASSKFYVHSCLLNVYSGAYKLLVLLQLLILFFSMLFPVLLLFVISHNF